MGGKDLILLYNSLVRSILEYSSVTYGPMLTKSQSNRLEQVQKRCLRIMFGYLKTYQDLLSESGLETLKHRREKALTRFLDKTLKNPNYAPLFPFNKSLRPGLRGTKNYLESFARTQRLYNSPLFTMKSLLNNSPSSQQFQETVVDLSYLFNDPE